MKKILLIAACIIGFGQAGLASDIPTTNWGAVLKVPLSKVGDVEKGLIEWGNWIKETHPMGFVSGIPINSGLFSRAGNRTAR